MRVLVALGGILLLYLAAIVGYAMLTAWQPAAIRTVAPHAVPTDAAAVIPDTTLRLLSWNLAHATLGDREIEPRALAGSWWWLGNTPTRPSLERYYEILGGQGTTLRFHPADFVLLQAVDTASRRSHFVQQLDILRSAYPKHTLFFAADFRTRRLPLPLLQPWKAYGAVESGLATLAAFAPDTTAAIVLPGQASWPQGLFQRKPLLLRQAYRVWNGKRLALYNLHLLSDGLPERQRNAQLQALRQQALRDAEAGHYVVVGGSWQQLPPGFNWFSLNPTVERIAAPRVVDFDFMPPGWAYAYDPAVATVREHHLPYDLHKVRRSVTDFFLVGPGVRIRSVQGIEDFFQFSDHHPVRLEIRLE